LLTIKLFSFAYNTVRFNVNRTIRERACGHHCASGRGQGSASGRDQGSACRRTTQQATTPTATTQRVKSPKRVAAGKMVAERNRLAREEQKKAAEAYYAEKQAKAATAAPKPAPDTKEKSLSANQWITIGGIGVSLLGIYYKREELMAMAKPVFDKLKTPEPAPPEPASVEPKPARDTRPRGF